VGRVSQQLAAGELTLPVVGLTAGLPQLVFDGAYEVSDIAKEGAAAGIRVTAQQSM
jgi:hypothetical protein